MRVAWPLPLVMLACGATEARAPAAPGPPSAAASPSSALSAQAVPAAQASQAPGAASAPGRPAATELLAPLSIPPNIAPDLPPDPGTPASRRATLVGRARALLRRCASRALDQGLDMPASASIRMTIGKDGVIERVSQVCKPEPPAEFVQCVSSSLVGQALLDPGDEGVIQVGGCGTPG